MTDEQRRKVERTATVLMIACGVLVLGGVAWWHGRDMALRRSPPSGPCVVGTYRNGYVCAEANSWKEVKVDHWKEVAEDVAGGSSLTGAGEQVKVERGGGSGDITVAIPYAPVETARIAADGRVTGPCPDRCDCYVIKARPEIEVRCAGIPKFTVPYHGAESMAEASVVFKALSSQIDAAAKKIERATEGLTERSDCFSQTARALEAASRFCRAWKHAMELNGKFLVLGGQKPVGTEDIDCDFKTAPGPLPREVQ